MLTGGSGLQDPTINPKGPFPLGPFPRHIWIHHNTPQDSLDKACHEIWKRVQGLSEELQPRSTSPVLQPTCHPLLSSEPLRGEGSNFLKESLEQNCVKDEISLLVEQEYLSLTQESISETETQDLEGSKETASTLNQTSSNNSLFLVSDRDQLLDETEAVESMYRAMMGSKEREMKLRSLCDAQLSTKSTIAGILRPSKCTFKNARGVDNGNPVVSNKETSKSLVPCPLKRTEAAKAPDNQMVVEETRLTKDYLQSNMFNSPTHKESAVVPPPSTTAESRTTGPKKQLPVFAKICSKTDPDSVPEGLQNTVTTAASDKNNLKYNGNVFTPRFATTSTTASLNQPVWLSLNYPPPPIYPNHSNFPQFQGLYPQRARIPYQQTLHPPLGCYSRQVTPYNPQQIFRSPYTPLLNYIPLVQPGYSYQQRNPSKPSSSVRDPPAMAGDGPQYHFSHSYGFSSTPGGSVRTNPYFSSSGSGINF
ncbi:uncharacterized protein C1orf94 homolog [Mauremys mutica]|uniref:uncharacterized protein C1orf94 homolog n=1 Tax=Mauremys mutica TaxID=74926 RepID=UPI001D1689FC|nr:uncharacterized protein C1orf94 homolog [Mauremys mutica]